MYSYIFMRIAVYIRTGAPPGTQDVAHGPTRARIDIRTGPRPVLAIFCPFSQYCDAAISHPSEPVKTAQRSPRSISEGGGITAKRAPAAGAERGATRPLRAERGVVREAAAGSVSPLVLSIFHRVV